MTRLISRLSPPLVHDVLTEVWFQKPRLLLNKKAILNEISRLGGELVIKIDVNRE